MGMELQVLKEDPARTLITGHKEVHAVETLQVQDMVPLLIPKRAPRLQITQVHVVVLPMPRTDKSGEGVRLPIGAVGRLG